VLLIAPLRRIAAVVPKYPPVQTEGRAERGHRQQNYSN